MGFGKANLDTVFEGFKYFKLKTPDPKRGEEMTEIIVRLLPSMHSYEDSGNWKFFYGQHYGHFGVNPRNPEKPRSRPFGCIQRKNKNKEIVVRCPKCEQIEKMRSRYDAAEDALAKQHGVDKKDPSFRDIKRADANLKKMGEWLGNHNCDKKFWINVMSLNGEFGVLQLSYTTCEKKLVPFLKRLRDQDKVDAFDPNGGVWLRFTRTGSKPQVQDNVETYDELVDIGNGRKAKVMKPAPMTAEQIEKALKICPDLAKGVVKFIDVETMERLVKSSGDPEETDRIWPPEPMKDNDGLKTTGLKAASTGASTSSDDDEPAFDNDEGAQSTTAASTTTTAPKTTEAAPADDEDAELERLLAKRKAREDAAAKLNGAKAADPASGTALDPVSKFLKDYSA